MSTVLPAPFVPYRALNDEGDPLAGGMFFAYEAGTDTPLPTYADPSGTVRNPHPVNLDDAGYGRIYLQAGVAYKLVLTDAQGVQQWTVDQVYGGGGGSGLVGVGSGTHTIVVRPEAGDAQMAGVVFPAGVLAMAVTLWVGETLGTSQGLTAVGIGTADLPDCWGMLPSLEASTETTAGVFLGYGGHPQPVSGTVTLTAYGGLFDATGEVYVTGHFLRFTPGSEVGYRYQGAASGGIPAATTDVPGVVELADSPETQAGVRGDVAVTPLGLATTLAALPGVGPATTTTAGIVELATPDEVALGLDEGRVVVPATLATRLQALPLASTTLAGFIELATTAEVDAGTDDRRAVTPLTLQQKLGSGPVPPATETLAGIAELATSAEVTTGTDAARIVTPLTLAQRLASLPPPPAASETVPGLVELATSAETTTGTDATRAVTPATLAAKVPTGTPLSLARYGASGQALETTPDVLTSSGGTLSVGGATPPTDTMLTVQSGLNLAPAKLVAVVSSTTNQGSAATLVRRSTGDMVDNFGVGLNFALEDTAAVENLVGQVAFRRQGADNSGRLVVRPANAGTLPAASAPGDLAVDPLGNVSVNADVFASGGTRVLALGPGTAPSSSPADTVQLWAADRGAAAGKRSLHVRTEDGTSHVLGDLAGIGTTLTATLGVGSYQALTVKGSQLLVGQSSVQERAQALIAPSWVVSTDATRTARLTLSVYDSAAAREGLRIETSGTAPMIGFLGASAVVRPTVPTAATDAATTQTLVNSLRTALISLGLVA